MSKQAALTGGAVIIIILMIAGLTFALLKKSTVSTGQTAVAIQNENPSPTENNKGTIQNLLTAGKNVTCEISDPQQNSKGSIFVAGEKFRVDITAKVNNGDLVSHTLQSDGFTYFWNDGSRTGSKISLSELKTATKSGQQPQTVEFSKEVEMECSPWTADSAKFVLPANVQFSDPSQTLKKIPPMDL